MEERHVFAGIDVSKAHLDVAVSGTDQVTRVRNSERGLAELIELLEAASPELVVMEATGGWEVPAAAALVAAEIPVVIANPRQVRDFAKSTGQLAKTDNLDANILALSAPRAPDA